MASFRTSVPGLLAFVTLLVVAYLAYPRPDSPGLPGIDHAALRVRSPDKQVRVAAAGEMLIHLRKGMSRREVERLIGPPDSFDGVLATWQVATHLCRPPEIKGKEIPVYYLVYEVRSGVPRLKSVEGPADGCAMDDEAGKAVGVRPELWLLNQD